MGGVQGAIIVRSKATGQGATSTGIMFGIRRRCAHHVATATVFSYPWANDLVYRVVGEAGSGRAPRGGTRRSSRPDGTAIDRWATTHCWSARHTANGGR
jgi:hypothetical protein